MLKAFSPLSQLEKRIVSLRGKITTRYQRY